MSRLLTILLGLGILVTVVIVAILIIMGRRSYRFWHPIELRIQ